jgi:hypothetical protein
LGYLSKNGFAIALSMAAKRTSKNGANSPAAFGAEPRGRSSYVIKSDLSDLLFASEASGVAGEFLWPIHPNSLANLYRASAEHCRAIQIKAETAFGGGLLGEKAAKFDDVCENGAAELCVALGLDLECFGNAFVQKIMSLDGKRLIELRRLPAVTISRFRGGFMQRILMPDGESKTITFAADEIAHLRVPCPLGKRYALPSWIGAEGMLQLAQSAIRFNASFFKNNAMPEYAVIFKGSQPTSDQKNAIRDFFRNEFGGLDNQHRTLVLTGNEDTEIKIEKLTADMKDADFMRLLDAARDRMPVAHGVPPRMLGIMTAGQLGGGGEVSSQLFIFEHLTLKPKRRSLLGQLRPILALLGLRPGANTDALAPDEIAFRPLDLTPPADDTAGLPELVQSGIVGVDEARSLLAFLQTENGESAPLQKSALGSPVKGDAAIGNPDTAASLIALLERL